MWLVDNKTDKVFKYTGDSGADKVFQYTAAASRTSGSQSAATSFALAVGNTNPQGIADPPSRGHGVNQVAHRRPTRVTEPALVLAIDDYLTTEHNQNAVRRSESLADSLLDTLFGLDQRRVKVTSLRHSLR